MDDLMVEVCVICFKPILPSDRVAIVFGNPPATIHASCFGKTPTRKPN